MKIIFFGAWLGLLFLSSFAQAQGVKIELGPDEIGENEGWTITLTVSNGELKSYGAFPDISGFRKRGASTQSQTSIINGQMSSTQSVVMTYSPTKQGVFTVPPFSIKINDLVINSSGKKIKVGAPVERQDPFSRFFQDDPFDNFYGRGSKPEYVDIKADAQLSLSVSRDQVYTGEGFTVTLSFLISDRNRAPMEFYQLGPQLTKILKKLKPSNCWEENFNIENIEGTPITIGNESFTQYKIYQAVFYPLNSEPIHFPAVGLEMVKYKVAKNPSFFGQNRQQDFKTFYTQPKTIRVKELPPHPLRKEVAVGRYSLEEKINKTTLRTGESAAYDFTILGEGNISAINKPMTLPSESLDVYEPSVKQTIRREQGRVMGSKTFSYFVIPKEPGKISLASHVAWVFFNLDKQKYDTLKPTKFIEAQGESQKNAAIDNSSTGGFYDSLSDLSNDLQIESNDNTKLYALLGLYGFAFIGFLFLYWKKKG